MKMRVNQNLTPSLYRVGARFLPRGIQRDGAFFRRADIRHNFDPGYAATAPGGFRLNGKSERVYENTLAALTIKPGEKIKLVSEKQPVQA